VEREEWNDRYAGTQLVWTAQPNRFVVAELEALPPGRALDLACGEGRNAVWLAERGWRVTGVDFSDVALAKARRLAAARGVEVEWADLDVRTWEPDPGTFDLVVVLYLQLPEHERRPVHARAAAAVAPGGTLLVVAHHAANPAEGHGGPQNPDVLFTEDDVAQDVAPLRIVRAERVRRPVTTPDGRQVDALDVLVRAERLSGDRA
jgi:SAM-dependent methyltransferase